MIAIAATGGANLASIVNAIERLGRSVLVTSDAEVIRRASHVILPGVGAANEAMRRLKTSALDLSIKDLTQPVLGICLGMQLLFAHSEEGDTPCLGLLPGAVRRLKPKDALPVPHMGWNAVRCCAPTPLLAGVRDDSHFYFVHSFACPSGPWVKAMSDYGGQVTAVVQKDNYFGVQFHPEKSAGAGMQILGNFINL